MPRTLHSARLYAQTIRHLRPIQVINRLWRLIYRPRPRFPVATAALSFPAVADWLPKHSAILSESTLRILNRDVFVDRSTWVSVDLPKLLLYNLHYFDFLFGSTGRESALVWLDRWIREVPVGASPGWDPYPTSLRVFNWIKWRMSNQEIADTAGIDSSLLAQVDWLSRRFEYHLLGNHLFENAKSLVAAGLFFLGGPADKWLRKGTDVLLEQLDEQILEDGGHFERSPMYHAILLEGILDLLIMLRRSRSGNAQVSRLDAPLTRAAERMTGWMSAISFPGRPLAFFNDTAEGIAPQPAALIERARELGIDCPDTASRTTHLAQSGYVVCRQGEMHLIFDVGPVGPDYLPGHAHADTLSFELTLGDTPVFVNSGISTYDPGPTRDFQRSSSAHNTVSVDGLDSSEMWAAFRVARRARASDVNIVMDENHIVVTARHDGFMRRHRTSAIHRREIEIGANCAVIRDRLSGHYRDATAFFHLHPCIEVTQLDPRTFRLSLSNALRLRLSVNGPGSVAIEDTAYYPSFNLTERNKTIVCRWQGRESVVKVTIEP